MIDRVREKVDWEGWKVIKNAILLHLVKSSKMGIFNFIGHGFGR